MPDLACGVLGCWCFFGVFGFRVWGLGIRVSLGFEGLGDPGPGLGLSFLGFRKVIRSWLRRQNDGSP